MQKSIFVMFALCTSSMYLHSSTPHSVCFTAPSLPYWQNVFLDDASKKRVVTYILDTIGHPGLDARRKKSSYSEFIYLRVIDTHSRIAHFCGSAVAAACQYPEAREYQAILLWKDDTTKKEEISLVISKKQFKDLQTSK